MTETFGVWLQPCPSFPEGSWCWDFDVLYEEGSEPFKGTQEQAEDLKQRFDDYLLLDFGNEPSGESLPVYEVRPYGTEG